MSAWLPTEPDLAAALERYKDPLLSLARAETPALILRSAYSPMDCKGLVRRFIDEGLMRDPLEPAPPDAKARIDVGTSLGTHGNDKEAFLEHSAKTHTLFESLFDDFEDPTDVIYDNLQDLAGDRQVVTAREPDGRPYGPAIFRIHYDSHTYYPHTDHVVLREKRFDFAVSRYTHQFAGILCLQNAAATGSATQAILHNCLWTEDIQPHIADKTFHQYAADNAIENHRVDLDVGDLYFFNTRCIHEVPAVQGSDPRIVLAVFIGFSEDLNEVFVWS